MILFFSLPLTSCDPHRPGAVSGQVGARNGMKRHTRPASAKRPRKNKY